jgi:predicted transcriptional regulator
MNFREYLKESPRLEGKNRERAVELVNKAFDLIKSGKSLTDVESKELADLVDYNATYLTYSKIGATTYEKNIKSLKKSLE